MPLEQFKKESSSTNREIDINDYVTIAHNPISRSGIFPYLGKSIGAPEPDKVYNVYRPATELENQEAINSFKLIPLINDHTMLGKPSQGLTAPEKKGIEGTTGDIVEFRNGILYANLKIFSQKMYDLIKRGKNNLSLGYRCIYEKASGIHEGKPYDYIQRNLRGNHLALVDEARCDVAVLDGMDAVITFDNFDINFIGDDTMAEKETKEDEKEEKMKSKAEDKKSKDEEEPKGVEGKEDDKEAKDEDMDDKKVEDEEEEKKAKDADMECGKNSVGGKSAKITDGKKGKDAEEKEDKKSGMDAKEIFKMVATEMKQRDVLAKQLSSHIGTFDASEKTLSEVAEYGIKKLGLKCEKGQEKAVLDGFMAGHKASSIGFGLDSGVKSASLENKFSNFLKAKK